MSSSRVYEWDDDDRNVHDYLPSSSYHSDNHDYKPVFTILKEMYEEDARRLYNIRPNDQQIKTIYDYWLESEWDDGEWGDGEWDMYYSDTESLVSYSNLSDGGESDDDTSCVHGSESKFYYL